MSAEEREGMGGGEEMGSRKERVMRGGKGE